MSRRSPLIALANSSFKACSEYPVLDRSGSDPKMTPLNLISRASRGGSSSFPVSELKTRVLVIKYVCLRAAADTMLPEVSVVTVPKILLGGRGDPKAVKWFAGLLRISNTS